MYPSVGHKQIRCNLDLSHVFSRVPPEHSQVLFQEASDAHSHDELVPGRRTCMNAMALAEWLDFFDSALWLGAMLHFKPAWGK